VKLGLKDMNLVLQQAAAVNQQMPLAELIRNNMETLIHSGKENIDWSAVSMAATNGPQPVLQN
jgi:3-hydroxyisobutyrate dehydrogenase-like beta-hydroxyacid dehydrogenase